MRCENFDGGRRSGLASRLAVVLTVAAWLPAAEPACAQGPPPPRPPQVPRPGEGTPASPPLPPQVTMPSGPVVPPRPDPTMAPLVPDQPNRAAAPVGPPPPSAAMDLASFEQIALRSNPTLAEAAAKVHVSRGRAWQAGLWPNPFVGWLGEQVALPGEGATEIGEMQGLRIRQEIPSANKRRISRRKYEWEAESARWFAVAQQLRVLNGVRIHFFEALAAQQILAFHRDLLRIADAALRTTEEMVNDGQANAPDLLSAQIQQQQARIAVTAAENQFRRAWIALVTTAGERALPPTRLEGPLDVEAPPLDFDATLAYILTHSPELKAAQAEVQRDTTMVQRERVEPVPNLTVQVDNGYNFADSGYATNFLIGGYLPVWNKNQGTIYQAKSDLARARANVERVQLSLEKRLADAFARYDTARVTVAMYRAESLPRAKKAYELLQDSYKRRRAAWPQVLVAERQWVELSVAYVTALFTLRQAETEIQGLLLVDGLTPPPGPNPLGHIDATPQPR